MENSNIQPEQSIEEELQDVKLENQALLERISELAAQYESRDAKRRVFITKCTNRIEQLEAHINDIMGSSDNQPAPVVSGEVVTSQQD